MPQRAKSGKLVVEMPSPFPETADELLARAREATSPIRAHGYFVAKTRELHGDPLLAEQCKQAWDAHEASTRPAVELASWEGVSSWEGASGARQTRIVHRKAGTDEVTVTNLA